MLKYEKTYKNEINKSTDLTFLEDLIKELKNTFYMIDSVEIDESEKETKYIANVVLMAKRNVSKKYTGGKKTNDNLSQVISKEGVN
ncbi:MAG: hypothetical protein M0P71_17980 [Melioribacteraceae bacterium]|jgi:hypothetical protein|nr:hypothetical protein [Melioribacteraceae bacterium]